MTLDKVQDYLNILPDSSIYFQEVLNYTTELSDVNRFLCAYKDLMFGYRFVSTIIKEDIDLPLDLEEDSIYKLYMHLKYKHKDKYITQALSLNHPSSKNMEDGIKALLFTNVSFAELSKATGIHEQVLKHYESLFYSIRSRKDEALFIANIVYPNTRIVETAENYVKTESTSNLLMRSAYNNGLDDVSYMLGLKSSADVFNNANAIDSAVQLESAIMANGLFLSRNGFLNQRNTGVSSAKNILIATKQSGASDEPGDTSNDIGTMMLEALQDIKGPEIDKKLSLIEQNELAKLNK